MKAVSSVAIFYVQLFFQGKSSSIEKMVVTCPPASSPTGWVVITVILFILLLVGGGLFLWYYFRSKCPSGQACRNSANPCTTAGQSCLNTANPCPNGQTCGGNQPGGPNLSNIATCPVCVPDKPIYMYGFTSNNNNYSSLTNSNGVMSQDAANVTLKPKVAGGANQTWLLELKDPTAAMLTYYIKNVTSGQYLTNTSGTALGLTPQKTSGAEFRILPVANRQGRTYVFRTGNNDLAVGPDLKVLFINAPVETTIPNNAEWMTSSI